MDDIDLLTHLVAGGKLFASGKNDPKRPRVAGWGKQAASSSDESSEEELPHKPSGTREDVIYIDSDDEVQVLQIAEPQQQQQRWPGEVADEPVYRNDDEADYDGSSSAAASVPASKGVDMPRELLLKIAKASEPNLPTTQDRFSYFARLTLRQARGMRTPRDKEEQKKNVFQWVDRDVGMEKDVKYTLVDIDSDGKGVFLRKWMKPEKDHVSHRERFAQETPVSRLTAPLMRDHGVLSTERTPRLVPLVPWILYKRYRENVALLDECMRAVRDLIPGVVFNKPDGTTSYEALVNVKKSTENMLAGKLAVSGHNVTIAINSDTPGVRLPGIIFRISLEPAVIANVTRAVKRCFLKQQRTSMQYALFGDYPVANIPITDAPVNTYATVVKQRIAAPPSSLNVEGQILERDWHKKKDIYQGREIHFYRVVAKNGATATAAGNLYVQRIGSTERNRNSNYIYLVPNENEVIGNVVAMAPSNFALPRSNPLAVVNLHQL